MQVCSAETSAVDGQFMSGKLLESLKDGEQALSTAQDVKYSEAIVPSLLLTLSNISMLYAGQVTQVTSIFPHLEIYNHIQKILLGQYDLSRPLAYDLDIIRQSFDTILHVWRFLYELPESSQLITPDELISRFAELVYTYFEFTAVALSQAKDRKDFAEVAASCCEYFKGILELYGLEVDKELSSYPSLMSHLTTIVSTSIHLHLERLLLYVLDFWISVKGSINSVSTFLQLDKPDMVPSAIIQLFSSLLALSKDDVSDSNIMRFLLSLVQLGDLAFDATLLPHLNKVLYIGPDVDDTESEEDVIQDTSFQLSSDFSDASMEFTHNELAMMTLKQSSQHSARPISLNRTLSSRFAECIKHENAVSFKDALMDLHRFSLNSVLKHPQETNLNIYSWALAVLVENNIKLQDLNDEFTKVMDAVTRALNDSSEESTILVLPTLRLLCLVEPFVPVLPDVDKLVLDGLKDAHSVFIWEEILEFIEILVKVPSVSLVKAVLACVMSEATSPQVDFDALLCALILLDNLFEYLGKDSMICHLEGFKELSEWKAIQKGLLAIKGQWQKGTIEAPDDIEAFDRLKLTIINLKRFVEYMKNPQ